MKLHTFRPSPATVIEQRHQGWKPECGQAGWLRFDVLAAEDSDGGQLEQARWASPSYYLPASGTAPNSNKLGGIDPGGFVQGTGTAFGGAADVGPGTSALFIDRQYDHPTFTLDYICPTKPTATARRNL